MGIDYNFNNNGTNKSFDKTIEINKIDEDFLENEKKAMNAMDLLRCRY